jgi:tetratricopeptide (TPR) repeat protein
MPELGTVQRLLSMAWRAQGHTDLALEHCERGIEVDRELPDLVALARDYLIRGVIALDMGDWQLAEESDLKAIDLLERAGARYQLAMTCCNLADKYRCMGDLVRGPGYARRGLDIFIKIESHQGVLFARVVLACLFWRQGELDQARTQLLGARELVERYNAVQFKPDIGRWLAQVCLTEGDLAQAEAEIQPLLSLEKRDLGVEFEPIQRLWGQILAARGRLDEALQVLQESLERLEQSPMRYKTAGTLLALANVLAKMEGRAAEARLYAERARAILTDLGARLDLQEAEALLARIG